MTTKILGISGSLRNGSYNLAALRVAKELLPDGASLEICEPLRLPMYSEEAERGGPPSEVNAFREKVASADAILFACPEYNYAISASLKNALEWASRPPNPPFAGKVCAIFGATVSPLGTMRAQVNLRQVCVSLNLHPINTPQVDIVVAQQKFDADGRLSDKGIRDSIQALLRGLFEAAQKIPQRPA